VEANASRARTHGFWRLNNVIQWIHRATRDGVYGGDVDRLSCTGEEIIKGHVFAGIARVRQDI